MWYNEAQSRMNVLVPKGLSRKLAKQAGNKN